MPHSRYSTYTEQHYYFGDKRQCCSSSSKRSPLSPSSRHGSNSIPNRVDSTAGQSHTHTSENTMNYRLLPSDGYCIAAWVATFLTCITLALS